MAPAPSSTGYPSPLRVMVIDDNVDAADTLEMLASAWGAETAVAYGGAAGLERAKSFHPDVAFIDIGMPGMDGHETCRRLRQALGDAPLLVALSGCGPECGSGVPGQAGFDAHFTKPTDPDEIETLMAQARGTLGQRRRLS